MSIKGEGRLLEDSVLISVIVPVFNIEHYLPDCLESILAQTYRNLEVILVDDGSTDGSAAVCEAYAQKDSRIRVIHKENGGVSSARNTGLDAARGELIGFVDGDDQIAPDMYMVLFEALVKHGADISSCDVNMLYGREKCSTENTSGNFRIWRGEAGVINLLSKAEMAPSVCNKLYVNTLFSELRFSDGISVNEDYLANYYLYKAAKMSVHVDVPLYFYLKREGSCTMSSFDQKQVQQLDVARIILDDLTEKLPELLVYGEKHLLCSLISVYNHSLSVRGYEELRKEIRLELCRYRPNLTLQKLCSVKFRMALHWIVMLPLLYDSLLRARAYLRLAKRKWRGKR